MSALLGTFVTIKMMSDGTPRITLDLQCTFAEIAALGLMPGIPFGVARISNETSIAAPEPIVEPTPEPKQRAGQLCIMACTFCADPLFFDWVDDRFMPAGEFMVRTEDEAKHFVLETCDISSRKELDSIPEAANTFHFEIRKPFMAWKAARGAAQ